MCVCVCVHARVNVCACVCDLLLLVHVAFVTFVMTAACPCYYDIFFFSFLGLLIVDIPNAFAY